jgi:hypothetical protein
MICSSRATEFSTGRRAKRRHLCHHLGRMLRATQCYLPGGGGGGGVRLCRGPNVKVAALRTFV